MSRLLKSDFILLLAAGLFLIGIFFTHAILGMEFQHMPNDGIISTRNAMLHSDWLFCQSLTLGLAFYPVVFLERYWASCMTPAIPVQRVLWLSLAIGGGGVAFGLALPYLDFLAGIYLIYVGFMGMIGCGLWFLLSAALLWRQRSNIRFHMIDLISLTLYSGIGFVFALKIQDGEASAISLTAWFLNAFFTFLACSLTQKNHPIWMPVMLLLGVFLFPTYWVLLVALQPQTSNEPVPPHAAE